MILEATELGTGEPVALLHGLFGDRRNLATLQRGLARRWRTIAFDLRNHGLSPHAPDMRYATQAADVLESLVARGARPAALVGHSMGGKTAMAAALAAPETVTRLVVADIAPVSYTPRNAALVKAMRGLDLTRPLTRAAAESALAEAVPDAGLRRFLVRNLETGESPHWRPGLEEIEHGMDAIEGFDAQPGIYEGPVLFLLGGRSGYVRPEHHDAIRARFPAARFETIDDAGHWLHADAPGPVLAAIEAFLAG